MTGQAMKSADRMNELRRCIDAYGAEPDRWPAERRDALAVLGDPVGLLVAQVAHADLHHVADPVEVLDHVAQDRGVAPLEALVGAAQVGVGVEVQQAEPRPRAGRGTTKAGKPARSNRRDPQ